MAVRVAKTRKNMAKTSPPKNKFFLPVRVDVVVLGVGGPSSPLHGTLQHRAERVRQVVFPHHSEDR